MEGVEGLGQRLKRVCLKAKFHRRARQHVSSEDLTMIGTTEVMPAPITPPDKRDAIEYNPQQPAKKAIVRCLGTGFTSDGDQEHVSFVPNATSHTLVTGIVDTWNEAVKTQALVDKKNETFITNALQGVGLQRQQLQAENAFLQPRDLAKGVVFDESESEQEIMFTESTSSNEEYSA